MAWNAIGPVSSRLPVLVVVTRLDPRRGKALLPWRFLGRHGAMTNENHPVLGSVPTGTPADRTVESRGRLIRVAFLHLWKTGSFTHPNLGCRIVETIERTAQEERKAVGRQAMRVPIACPGAPRRQLRRLQGTQEGWATDYLWTCQRTLSKSSMMIARTDSGFANAGPPD